MQVLQMDQVYQLLHPAETRHLRIHFGSMDRCHPLENLTVYWLVSCQRKSRSTQSWNVQNLHCSSRVTATPGITLTIEELLQRKINWTIKRLQLMRTVGRTGQHVKPLSFAYWMQSMEMCDSWLSRSKRTGCSMDDLLWTTKCFKHIRKFWWVIHPELWLAPVVSPVSSTLSIDCGQNLYRLYKFSSLSKKRLTFTRLKLLALLKDVASGVLAESSLRCLCINLRTNTLLPMSVLTSFQEQKRQTDSILNYWYANFLTFFGDRPRNILAACTRYMTRSPSTTSDKSVL